MAGCIVPGIGRSDGMYPVYPVSAERFPADLFNRNPVAHRYGAFYPVHCSDGGCEVGETRQEKGETMISIRGGNV